MRQLKIKESITRRDSQTLDVLWNRLPRDDARGDRRPLWPHQRERVRQIKEKAIRKLKHSAGSESLRVFLG